MPNPVISYRAALVLAILVTAAAVLLIAPQTALSDASGCSRFDGHAPNYTPSGDPRCAPQPGSVCYYCEYSHISGYTVCAEGDEAGLGACVDYDDLPPYNGG